MNLADFSHITTGCVSWHGAQPLTWSLIGYHTCLEEWFSVTEHQTWCETYLLPSFSVLIFVDNGYSHGSHEALAGWDFRHPRLVIHPHVLIWFRFYRHALSHFVLAQVETCGLLTNISQTTYKTCSDNPQSLLNPKHRQKQIWLINLQCSDL